MDRLAVSKNEEFVKNALSMLSDELDKSSDNRATINESKHLPYHFFQRNKKVKEIKNEIKLLTDEIVRKGYKIAQKEIEISKGSFIYSIEVKKSKQ